MEFINNKDLLNNLRNSLINQQQRKTNSDKTNEDKSETVFDAKNINDKKDDNSFYGNAVSLSFSQKKDEPKININDNANAALKSVLNNLLNNMQKPSNSQNTTDNKPNTQNINSATAYSKTANTFNNSKNEVKQDTSQQALQNLLNNLALNNRQKINVQFKPEVKADEKPVSQAEEPVNQTTSTVSGTPETTITEPVGQEPDVISVDLKPAQPTRHVKPLEPEVPSLPSISFPEIPEEKGSYENGTLVIFTEDTDEEGNIYKTWSYTYSSKSSSVSLPTNASNDGGLSLYAGSSQGYDDGYETKNIMQKYDEDGTLLSTYVIESKYDEDDFCTYSLMNEFDAQNNCISKDEYKVDFPDSDNMRITTTHDPVTSKPIQNVDTVKMAKTVVRTEEPASFSPEQLNFIEYLSCAGIYNLQMKYDLSNIENLGQMDGFYDLYKCMFTNASNSNLPFPNFQKIFNNKIYVKRCEYNANKQLSQIPSLNSDFNNWSINYDDKGRLTSISTTDKKYNNTVEIIYERDDKGNLTGIRYTGAKYFNKSTDEIQSYTFKVVDNQLVPSEYILKKGDTVIKSLEVDENMNILSEYETKTGGSVNNRYTYTREYNAIEKIYIDKYLYADGLYKEQHYSVSGSGLDLAKNAVLRYEYNECKSTTDCPTSNDPDTDDLGWKNFNDVTKRWTYYYDAQNDNDAVCYCKEEITCENGGYLKSESVTLKNGESYAHEVSDKYYYTHKGGWSVYTDFYTYHEVLYTPDNSYEYTYSPGDNDPVTWITNKNTGEDHYSRGNVISYNGYDKFLNGELKTASAESIELSPNEKKELPEEFGKKLVITMSRDEIIEEINTLYERLNTYTSNRIKIKETTSLETLQDTLTELRQQYAIVDGEKNGALDGKIGTIVSFSNSNGTTTANEPTVAELQAKLQKLADSMHNEGYENTFYKSNKQAIEDLLDDSKNPTALDLQKMIDKFYWELNGKIELNEQQTGDCWFLAAINSLTEADLKNIMTINADGSVDVTFAPYTSKSTASLVTTSIDEKGKEKKSVQKVHYSSTSEPIHVDKTEYIENKYKNMTLSLGDLDVKVLEIAFYKLLEENGIDLAKYVDGGISADAFGLFGKNTTTYDSFCWNTHNDIYLKNKSSSPLLQIIPIFGLSTSVFNFIMTRALIDEQMMGNTYLENMGLNVINQSSYVTAGTLLSNMEFNEKEYSMWIDYKKSVLINMGGFQESEVEEAATLCKRLGRETKDGILVNIKNKEGNDQWIYGSHAYTVKGYKNGYVELVNPHNNAESFEISEVLFRLLFGNIVISK